MSHSTASTHRVALITGVSRHVGIGAAIARRLAEDGISVFMTYYRPFDRMAYAADSEHDAAEILAALRARGVQAHSMEANLGEPATPAQLFDEAQARIGLVDILINNAAYDQPGDLYNLTTESLDAHYRINVRGAVLLSAEFARRHDGRPGGRIVNLTSGQGLHPMPDNLPYAVTKGAVEALTISLAPTLARKGITVNAIDPGPTDSGWMDDQLRAELTLKAPFGRIGLPTDAANLVAFLVSPLAGWITGQILRSRGGF